MARGDAQILVTDAQDRCGLSAIRCLSAAGYQVTASGLERSAPGLWAGGCRRRRVLPDPRENLDAFVEALVRLLRAEPHDVVVIGRDETLFAISARRPQIEEAVQTGLPPHAVVERALDKQVLAEEAAKVGLAVPDQRLCASPDAALAAGHEFGWPLLVKPTAVCYEDGPRVGRHPSRLVSDEPALREAQREIGRCLVQQRVRGRMLSISGVATESGLLGVVFARHVRIWPPEAGNVSFAETIEPPPGLIERTESLVGGIGWRGIFQLELIEGRDGVHHALDFNPRLWASIGLARAAGAPLSTLWCDWLLGEHPPRIAARPRVHYRFEEGEVNNLRWHLRRRELREVARILRPRSATAHSYFQLSDPVPWLIYVYSMACRFLPLFGPRAWLRRVRRITRALGMLPTRALGAAHGWPRARSGPR